MKPQKALHLYKDEELKTPKSQGRAYWAFEKYDGWYGYYEGGKVYSRAGREIPSCADLAFKIREAFGGLNPHGRMIFEILVEGHTEFSTVNGILNRKKVQPNIYVMVHDYISPDYMSPAFGGTPDAVFKAYQPFKKRYHTATKVVEQLGIPDVLIAPVLHMGYPSELTHTCEAVWAQGGEGIIMKDPDAGYSPDKRNADLLKIKEEVTLDLLVIGYELGQGKYSHTLGKLIVWDRKGNTFYVSGMSDRERDMWFANFGLCIDGKVVEVKAMKILKNADGSLSLREPRFKAIRHDKGVEDID